MALPIPLLPPVTMATLFFKSMNRLLYDIRSGGLYSRRSTGIPDFRVFIPVDAPLVASIQNLNRPGLAEIVPGPIDEGFDSLP